MMPEENILRTRRIIVRDLSMLERMTGRLEDVMNNLSDIETKIGELHKRIIIRQSLPDDLIKSVALFNSYAYYNKRHASYLRDIDATTASIAGFIALLIDDCFATRDVNLKFWIKNRIAELNDARQIESDGKIIAIPLPTANAILLPYLEKTRYGENAPWFASVRNAIRELLK